MKVFQQKHTVPRFLIPCLAYLLGLVFLVAGVSKFFSFQEFVANVKGYGIFPQDVIPVLAFILIVIEIAVGALFFIKRTQGVAGGTASVLLAGFIVLVVYAKTSTIERGMSYTVMGTIPPSGAV